MPHAFSTRAENELGQDTPPPWFFGTAHSKGVSYQPFVSAESKGLICTKIVQNRKSLGSAESKGLSEKRLDVVVYSSRVARMTAIVNKNIVLMRYTFQRAANAFRRRGLRAPGGPGLNRDSRCGIGYFCYSAGA